MTRSIVTGKLSFSKRFGRLRSSLSRTLTRIIPRNSYAIITRVRRNGRKPTGSIAGLPSL